jgi:hypothetical protein
MPKFKIIKAPSDLVFRTSKVEGDGSCFFHSLYTCLSAAEYKEMSPADKFRFVRKERLRLASLLTLKTFLNLAGGEVVTLMVERNFMHYLKRALKKYKLQFSPVNFYNEYVLNTSSNKNFLKAQSLDDSVIYEDYPRFNAKIKKIILKCQQEAFDVFVENLADPAYYIDNFYIQFVMDVYKINILFFNSDGTYYPTCNFEDMLQTGFPFILFHYISETHFEPIAEVKDEILVRYFLPSHPLIRYMKKSLFNTRLQKDL